MAKIIVANYSAVRSALYRSGVQAHPDLIKMAREGNVLHIYGQGIWDSRRVLDGIPIDMVETVNIVRAAIPMVR